LRFRSGAWCRGAEGGAEVPTSDLGLLAYKKPSLSIVWFFF